ncbi:MAG: PAS domain-containing protein [Sulfuricurvum sp.]|nr:PAS domain-containing protein [Sulfuricurvum sp.]
MKAICMETEVPNDELIVSHTNLYGIITYANDTFADISGYEIDELIGKPHNIVRHPDMPASLFTNLWETLKEGKIWSGYVKNLRSDGGYYWVYAQVSHLIDKNNNLIGYKSLRAPVDIAKRHELEISYARLKEMEENLVKMSEWIDKATYQRITTLSQNENRSVSDIISDLIGTP